MRKRTSPIPHYDRLRRAGLAQPSNQDAGGLRPSSGWNGYRGRPRSCGCPQGSPDGDTHATTAQDRTGRLVPWFVSCRRRTARRRDGPSTNQPTARGPTAPYIYERARTLQSHRQSVLSRARASAVQPCGTLQRGVLERAVLYCGWRLILQFRKASQITSARTAAPVSDESGPLQSHAEATTPAWLRTRSVVRPRLRAGAERGI